MFSAMLRSSQAVALLKGAIIDGEETLEVKVEKAKSALTARGRSAFVGLAKNYEERKLWCKFMGSIRAGKMRHFSPLSLPADR